MCECEAGSKLSALFGKKKKKKKSSSVSEDLKDAAANDDVEDRQKRSSLVTKFFLPLTIIAVCLFLSPLSSSYSSQRPPKIELHG